MGFLGVVRIFEIMTFSKKFPTNTRKIIGIPMNCNKLFDIPETIPWKTLFYFTILAHRLGRTIDGKRESAHIARHHQHELRLENRQSKYFGAIEGAHKAVGIERIQCRAAAGVGGNGMDNKCQRLGKFSAGRNLRRLSMPRQCELCDR